MIVRRLVLAASLALMVGPVLAQSVRWTTVSASDGEKFGVGFGNNFTTFYVTCTRGAVIVNAETEGQEGARQTGTVTINGRAFRISGVVEPGPEGDWLSARIPDPGAFLDAMGAARSVSVQTASGRVNLTTAGLAAAVRRGVARCR